MVAVAALPVIASGSATPGDWYLAKDHAAAAHDLLPALLPPVRVAVIDSGIDGSHPAFAGAIVAARSFVGGSPLTDELGHGTFVAGEIEATAGAAVGPGSPSPVRLVVAKIVARDGSLTPEVEAKAIRWAVAAGARVVNLSFGGLRDPHHPELDQYSAAEAAAVRYAISHHVVVVAAVGNTTDASHSPWPYADWPAALPHVIGVSAIGPDGNVAAFSNHDQILNEIAAPAVGIVSTFPRALTAASPGCADQGYSDCGPADYQSGQGTSFAAPQVAAAAALLLSVNPGLTPDQVSWLLERSADDANPATGCAACAVGRDPLTGRGTLDIANAVAALAQPFPPPDPCATSNDAGSQACRLPGNAGQIQGALDYWEHPLNVYRLHVPAGGTLTVHLTGSDAPIQLLLWRPGTVHVLGPAARDSGQLLVTAPGAAGATTLTWSAKQSGWYYLETRISGKSDSIFTLTFGN